MELESGVSETSKGPAILWYKHDLRIDDHPGLLAASQQHRTLVPLYVFDHRILSRMLSFLPLTGSFATIMYSLSCLVLFRLSSLGY